MIRLWHRVGTFRAVAALSVLLAAVVAGLVIAGRQAQHETSADPVHAADAAALPQASPSLSAAPSSAQAEAQTKAQDAASAAAGQAKAAEDEARRKAEEEASRNKTRTTNPTNSAPKYPVPSSCDVYTGNKKTGCAVLVGTGFGLDQMPCLEKLWQKESGWNHTALNRGSGAYGIPQALPGSKMASAGADWKTNPETQIRWGLGYIKGRYKTPCAAWSHSQQNGWY
ncbi:lytic transglycosylase domain-containing protein [Dactylosporangium roseum]|uniref:Lytic transglycosylase domain-containing protein n=1 Tax=Dactylosporangium roseum TaxID=47989 RepID=A0ABY5Z6B6_9ACTN|nr:lytic transglycosylase domain-containing protein [Dactylosporangium roseum]UWZ37598.1 lytic transglycosylase domain-containing protein [Dactylosporangium roseum]